MNNDSKNIEAELRKIISEEIYRIIEDDEPKEAEISSALSFMQDTQSSVEKLKNQKELTTTVFEVDHHLEQAINHVREAIKKYFETISPDAKQQVINRIGEVNI